MSAPEKTPSVKRRTVVYIDSFDPSGQIAMCTVSGVDLPSGIVPVLVSAMPGDMRLEAEPRRVFFAYANLNAERTEDVGVERIERRWGETDGPLHFEAPDAR